jgi:hypothetical protein
VNIYTLAIIILGVPYIAGNIYVIRLFHGSLKNGYKNEKLWQFILLLLVGLPSILMTIAIFLLSGGKITLISKKNENDTPPKDQ